MYFHFSLRQTSLLSFLSQEILHLAIQLYLLPSQVGFFFSSSGVFNLAILHLRFNTGPSLLYRVRFISAILSSLHSNDSFSPRFLLFYVPFIAAIHSFLHANGSLLPLLLWLEVSFIPKASSFLHAKLRSVQFSRLRTIKLSTTYAQVLESTTNGSTLLCADRTRHYLLYNTSHNLSHWRNLSHLLCVDQTQHYLLAERKKLLG